jgi:hypothetical protein
MGARLVIESEEAHAAWIEQHTPIEVAAHATSIAQE